jgi:hypothetical protein
VDTSRSVSVPPRDHGVDQGRGGGAERDQVQRARLGVPEEDVRRHGPPAHRVQHRAPLDRAGGLGDVVVQQVELGARGEAGRHADPADATDAAVDLERGPDGGAAALRHAATGTKMCHTNDGQPFSCTVPR